MFAVVDIPPSVIERATDLAEKHALRGYDAVQLAAALAVHSMSQSHLLPYILISADAELNAAAAAEGLLVEDPNQHP
jgi:predicted nucleic acid-binding protein